MCHTHLLPLDATINNVPNSNVPPAWLPVGRWYWAGFSQPAKAYSMSTDRPTLGLLLQHHLWSLLVHPVFFYQQLELNIIYLSLEYEHIFTYYILPSPSTLNPKILFELFACALIFRFLWICQNLWWLSRGLAGYKDRERFLIFLFISLIWKSFFMNLLSRLLSNS